MIVMIPVRFASDSVRRTVEADAAKGQSFASFETNEAQLQPLPGFDVGAAADWLSEEPVRARLPLDLAVKSGDVMRARLSLRPRAYRRKDGEPAASLNVTVLKALV